MRVKLSSSPPLPPLRAWFPLSNTSTTTVSSFKSVLCASLPDFGGIVPSSLRLSIDGFELLDNSELTVIRDGDLISVDTRGPPAHAPICGSRKRKRDTPESQTSESSDTESTSSSESESSDSDSSEAPPPAAAKSVPPGQGKPQTRGRNLRRRLKRMHERDADGPAPVSGANALGPDPPLMSLSLRNKNKAKNFRSLMSRPLPAKITFGQVPRLVPPSERASLPDNVIVTSVDVEAAQPLDEWDSLERVTRDNVTKDSLVGYKALGIDPVTYTPEKLLTVARVESCGGAGLVVRALHAEDAESEEHAWEDIDGGDWRVLNPSLPEL